LSIRHNINYYRSLWLPVFFWYCAFKIPYP